MTLALSTSSAWVSVAVREGGSDRQYRTHAPRAASAALVQALQELGVESNQLEHIVVDIGPGSFTGVRVGVTFAKVLADETGSTLGTVTSFDLVDPSRPVAVPSKKGEVFLRVPGHEPVCVPVNAVPPETVLVGGDVWPDAERALALASEPVDPLAVVPLYVAPPAISQATKPHIMGGSVGKP